MDIYNYSSITGEFIGMSKADLNPLEKDQWIIPALATPVLPPETGDNEIAVFLNGEWLISEDHRGTVVYGSDGSKKIIQQLGAIPSDVTLIAPERPFLEIQREALVDIDTAAERSRLNFITPGNGQAMVYQQKVSEAERYQSAVTPSDSDCPILSKEAMALKIELSALVAIVLSKRDQWLDIAGQIEVIRTMAKADISAATTSDQIPSILDVLIWP